MFEKNKFYATFKP